MSSKVLVAYATKHGSTHEVADGIAEVLQKRGLDVTTLEAGDVTDVASFDGVVLGGSVYMGRWHAEARGFLRRHGKQLASRQLAVFAIGPLTSEPDDLASARRQLDHALAKLTEVHPERVAVFGGVVDPSKLNFPFNHIAATDARDWNQIRDWACELAADFTDAKAVEAADYTTTMGDRRK
jgi:menaquinone-dependent protoporphyrinogen oxidase